MIFKAKIAAIEFDGDEVRVALVKTGGARPVVLELSSSKAEYETQEAYFDAMVTAVDEALNKLSIRPAAYVLCANCMYSVVRMITIPFKGRRRVLAAVPFELEPYLAFPIEELLVDFNIVTEIDGETDVFTLGMRREHLENYMEILAAAGVDLDAISLDAVGLTGLWLSGQKRLKGLHAVLHVREESASLAILNNKQLAYFRPLSMKPTMIQESPGVVAREVQNTLRSFLATWRGDGELAELSLTGMQLSTEERAAFSAALHLPVKDEVMISQLKGGALALEEGAAGGKSNHWEAAVGVALGAGGGGCLIDFTKTEKDVKAPLRAMMTHAIFSACLALIVLVGWAFYFHQATERNNALATEYEAQLSGLMTEIDALAEEGLGPEIDTTMYSDPTLLAILDEISQKLPEAKVNIDEIKINAPESTSWWIRIQGRSTDVAQFNQAYKELASSALFQVKKDPSMSAQGGVTTFAIELYRKEATGDESAT